MTRRTKWIFDQAGQVGYVPKIDSVDRQQAHINFVYWSIDTVLLPDTATGPHGMSHHDTLLEAAARLLGPPELAGSTGAGHDTYSTKNRPGIDSTNVASN